MAGRKPLPTEIKKLRGTLQKCRTNPHEPQPQGDLVAPPEYMSDGAKQAWRYAIDSAPEHLLRKLDMSVLEVWSCAADLYRKAQIMTKAAVEMGFTPASRSRITQPTDTQIDLDPWADIAG